MAEQTQVDRVDTPTENITATATGEMPSPKLAKDRETATKKRSRLRFIVPGIVIVLAIAGFFVWRYMNTYEDTDDAQVDGHINNVSARVSGYVLKVNVDDNQYVQKGAVLRLARRRVDRCALAHHPGSNTRSDVTTHAFS